MAGIGAAAGLRLGHGESRAHLAVDDGPEPFVLLRRRAGLGEQVHVAVVGRHAVDRERPEDRTRGLLVDRRPGDDRQPHAADIPSAIAAPTGPPPWPSRAPGRAASCGMFSCSAKFAGSASSGSTCSSMKARTRRRMSSISGERVKSMVLFPTLDLHRPGRRRPGWWCR